MPPAWAPACGLESRGGSPREFRCVSRGRAAWGSGNEQSEGRRAIVRQGQARRRSDGGRLDVGPSPLPQKGGQAPVCLPDHEGMLRRPSSRHRRGDDRRRRICRHTGRLRGRDPDSWTSRPEDRGCGAARHGLAGDGDACARRGRLLGVGSRHRDGQVGAVRGAVESRAGRLQARVLLSQGRRAEVRDDGNGRRGRHRRAGEDRRAGAPYNECAGAVDVLEYDAPGERLGLSSGAHRRNLLHD